VEASASTAIGRPDVAPAVAVVIDRIGQEAGRDELRVAHGPGPGSGHLPGRHVARLQDLQGGDQLRLEELSAASVISQRRHGRDDVGRSPTGAIGAFEAPDGGHDLRLDAVPALDPLQRLAMFGHGGASVADPRVRHRAVEIIPERAAELSLVAVTLDDPFLKLHAVEGPVERVRRDPQAERALTEPGDPAAEFGVGGGGGTGGGDGAGRAAQDRAERAADRVHRRGTAFDRCGQDARLRHRVGPFQRRNGGQRWKGRRGSRHHQDGKDKRGDAAHVGRSVLLDVADNLAENRVRVTCPCRNGRDIAGIRRDPAVSRAARSSFSA
jgi:hypothetical protein